MPPSEPHDPKGKSGASGETGEHATVERPRVTRPPSRTTFAGFELRVLDGPDRGTILTLDGSQPPRILIGKSPVCELRLTDEQVSRRHAAIDHDSETGRVRIVDLGSTNGTQVNGVTVFDAALLGGESIRLGATVLQLRPASSASNAGAPSPPTATFGRLVGASPEMRRLYPLCARIAASRVPVVLEGETGTGKEVLAESIHEMGPLAKGPFVVFDCTTVAANLLESALFGHERGAFTGATDTHIGVFEEASGGTLLIDEIGDLDLQLQAKLLRAIERSEIRRVGGKSWIKVEVRILAATRRDLDQEVQAGRFRDDLFFRIAVGRIELPPLRRRPADIETLTRHFWGKLGGVGAPSSELLARFREHAWPGNVRELHNAVARHLAFEEPSGRAESGESAALTDDVTDDLASFVLSLDLPLPVARARLVEEFERRYVARAVERHGGNVSRAAEASGLARRYFQLLRSRRGR